jgi:hypothetical protein
MVMDSHAERAIPAGSLVVVSGANVSFLPTPISC